MVSNLERRLNKSFLSHFPITAEPILRWRVVQHSREAYAKLVELAGSPESDAEEDDETPEDLAAERLPFFLKLFNISESEHEAMNPDHRINTSADILTKWPKLVRAFGLDGVTEEKTSEERERDRAAFKEGIMTGLEGRSDNELMAGLEFPGDFWVLMGQVDSLHGHGWPNYRAHEWRQQQTIFWSGIECSELGAKHSLVYPDELPLSGWEVLGGWECGYGRENTTCYVLYCRREDGLPCEKESDTNWHWRYVVDINQNGVEFFDDVIELLA
ncbi:hypothetical protein PG996_010083 [Apiospora saccharicola]|uniref:Knr4/Smi1-like domain-containing protein n=1 Tax=Apiospora saccharicola TaxID=335842 RepID=A0ABR1UQM1_9PEZI